MEQIKMGFQSDGPVLDFIRPAWAEQWQKEGLFRRAQHGGGDVRESEKKAFVVKLYTDFFYDGRNSDLADVRGGQVVSWAHVLAERKDATIQKFNLILNKEMREIMAEMILRPPPSARAFARKKGMMWPQYVIDFNYWLDFMMTRGRE